MQRSSSRVFRSMLWTSENAEAVYATDWCVHVLHKAALCGRPAAASTIDPRTDRAAHRSFFTPVMLLSWPGISLSVGTPSSSVLTAVNRARPRRPGPGPGPAQQGCCSAKRNMFPAHRRVFTSCSLEAERRKHDAALFVFHEENCWDEDDNDLGTNSDIITTKFFNNYNKTAAVTCPELTITSLQRTPKTTETTFKNQRPQKCQESCLQNKRSVGNIHVSTASVCRKI